eukprot:COSAG04_NODE_6370_length_1344_cov_4.143775_2_plen_180_part_00
MNGARIGRGSIVGAGALVLEHFEAPPYSLIVGQPATVKREYTDQSACLGRAAKTAASYAARAAAYRRSLREILDELPEGPDAQWEAAAQHNARLGYPQLLGNDADHHRHRERPLDEPGALLRDDASDHSASSLPRPELDRPPRERGERGGGGGGGLGGIAVAAVAGAIASIVLNVLRRR